MNWREWLSGAVPIIIGIVVGTVCAHLLSVWLFG